MAFDAKAFREAYQPPVYTDLQGTPHTGCILSRFEWLAVEEDARTLDQGTAEEQREKARRVLTAFFPEDVAVVEEILHLPSAMFDEAVGDFFACQRPPRPNAASAPSETPAGPSSAAS